METGNKICPRCSTSVDREATTCTQCDYDFVTGLESDRYRYTVSSKLNRFGCLKFVGIAAIAIGAIGLAGHYLGLSIALW